MCSIFFLFLLNCILVLKASFSTSNHGESERIFKVTKDTCLTSRRSLDSIERYYAPYASYIVVSNDDSTLTDLHELSSLLFTNHQLFTVAVHYTSLLKGLTLHNVSGNALDAMKKQALKVYRSKIFKATEVINEAVTFNHSVDRTVKLKVGYGPSWGLDRIDQQSLPLDGQFNSPYDGSGSNIFIVDSGIDTTHIEFETKGVNRIVKNLYDIENSHPTDNNDALGHGTHTAGTAGGLTTGVAPGANIYGIRVLDSRGQGTTENIMKGLSFILDWYNSNEKPDTIVSLSLGGNCLSYEECEDDLLVVTCEKLVAAGITVIAAAGNDGCDSCLQTPSFAPNVVTVGASDEFDRAAIFSDYGKCVDLYAPGVGIRSACASAVCNTVNMYMSLSGTSMACPHATGVAALIYQMEKQREVALKPSDVADIMLCNAAKMKLSFSSSDFRVVRFKTIRNAIDLTRNTLLQIPSKGSSICDLGEGCNGLDGCSNHGLCQQGHCLCDTKYWGIKCESQLMNKHCSNGNMYIEYTLYHATIGPWRDVEFRVTRADSNDVILATSMCAGTAETSGFCVEPDVVHQLDVSGSGKVADIAWDMCGNKGGAPFTLAFKVQADGNCEIVCDNPELEVGLYPGTSNLYHDVGWGGAHYTIFSASTGKLYAGGSLLPKQRVDIHPHASPPLSTATTLLQLGGEKVTQKVCLLDGTYALVIEAPSAHSASTSAEYQLDKPTVTMCDTVRLVGVDFLFFQVMNGVCTVLSPSLSDSTETLLSYKAHAVVLGMFNLQAEQWTSDLLVESVGDAAHLSLTNSDMQLGRSKLLSGAAAQVYFSLHHPVETGHGFYKEWRIVSGVNASLPPRTESFWISCGVRGTLTESYKFKYLSHSEDEKAVTDLEIPNCVQACLPLFINSTRDINSYMLSEDILFYFVSALDTAESLVVDMRMVDGYKRAGSQVAGMNNVCVGNTSLVSSAELSTACYRMVLGAGTVLALPVWNFCGRSDIPSSAIIDFCVTDFTDCKLIQIYTPQCTSASSLAQLTGMYIYMVSLSRSFGWAGATYSISSGNEVCSTGGVCNEYKEPVIDVGTLSDSKQSAAGDICLVDGCYRLNVAGGEFPEAVLWFFCGMTGSANGPTLVFRILDGTCLPQKSMESCNNPYLVAIEQVLSKMKFFLLFIFLFLVFYSAISILSYCISRSGAKPNETKGRHVLTSILSTGYLNDPDLATSTRPLPVTRSISIEPRDLPDSITESFSRTFPQNRLMQQGGYSRVIDHGMSTADDTGDLELQEVTFNPIGGISGSSSKGINSSIHSETDIEMEEARDVQKIRSSRDRDPLDFRF